MAANRRKRFEPVSVVTNSASSGTVCDSENAASSDRVIFFVALSAIAAGSVTFKIQSTPNDGASWHDLTTGEMLGNTGALTAAGDYHVAAEVPFGTRLRLAYTIVTGPVTFGVYPCYERTGAVHN